MCNFAPFNFLSISLQNPCIKNLSCIGTKKVSTCLYLQWLLQSDCSTSIAVFASFYGDCMFIMFVDFCIYFPKHRIVFFEEKASQFVQITQSQLDSHILILRNNNSRFFFCRKSTWPFNLGTQRALETELMVTGITFPESPRPIQYKKLPLYSVS